MNTMEDKTILYVEDNFHNRRIVRKILGTRGYTIIEAEDGLIGYEMICEIKPPLVLLDIALPHLDGMQIVQRLKADDETKHIPVIALTASAMRGDRERFLEAGCDDYLSKPVRAHELIEMVDKYFNQESDAPETTTPDDVSEPTAATPVTKESKVEVAETTIEDAVEQEPEMTEEAIVEEVEETAPVEVVAIENDVEAKEEVEQAEVVAELVEELAVELVASPTTVAKVDTGNYDKILSDNVASLFGEDVVLMATPKQDQVPAMDAPVAFPDASSPGTASVWVIDENPSEARLMRRMIGARLKIDIKEVSPMLDAASLANGAPALILVGAIRPDERTYATLRTIRSKPQLNNTPIFLLTTEFLNAAVLGKSAEYVELAWTKDKLMDSDFLSLITKKLASIFSSGNNNNKDNQVAEAPPQEPKVSSATTVNVLVIEDIPDSAALAKKILLSNNYGVHIADSGEAGLMMALEHKPKMILLDLGLPDVDGQTLLGVLRAEDTLKDTPVIVCTAWPEDALKEIVASYGFDDYISKPYKVAEFMEVVNRYSA